MGALGKSFKNLRGLPDRKAVIKGDKKLRKKTVFLKAGARQIF